MGTALAGPIQHALGLIASEYAHVAISYSTCKVKTRKVPQGSCLLPKQFILHIVNTAFFPKRGRGGGPNCGQKLNYPPGPLF